jgi:flagellar biosynthesis/type III secretory pathway protein FliH
MFEHEQIEEIRRRYADFDSRDIRDPKTFPGWRQVMEDIEYLLAVQQKCFDQGKEEGIKIGEDETMGYWYEEGAREGEQKGYTEGFELGKDKGHEEGYEEGHEHGEQFGRDQARDEAFEEAYEHLKEEVKTVEGGAGATWDVPYIIGKHKGWLRGFKAGHTIGYDEGYDIGYKL